MRTHMRKDAERARWLAVSLRGFGGRSGDLRGRQVQHEQLIQIVCSLSRPAGRDVVVTNDIFPVWSPQ